MKNIQILSQELELSNILLEMCRVKLEQALAIARYDTRALRFLERELTKLNDEYEERLRVLTGDVTPEDIIGKVDNNVSSD